MPTPRALVVSPAAAHAMTKPAITGPSTRAKFMPAVFNAIAVKMRRLGTKSGTKAWRAGMENASTEPLKRPNQMKSANVTRPAMMIAAIATVATQFESCAMMRMRRLTKRSATTPPHSDRNTCGAMKESVTNARSVADSVIA